MKKKVQLIFLQIQQAPFRQNITRKSIKNASLLAHHASNNKNKNVVHPTGHGNAQFGPTQKPTNDPVALI
jgi:hypothetical protein